MTAADVDRGDLAVVADIDDLAVDRVDRTLERQAAAGRAHRGLVEHDDHATRQGTAAITKFDQQPVGRHRERLDKERSVIGSAWVDLDLVFPSQIGTPFDPRNLNRHFTRTCERAGIGRRRFHDLRHTCASLLLAQNVHARIVMETLGHAGIQVTMDTYSHVMPKLQRDAADQIERILRDDEDQ